MRGSIFLLLLAAAVSLAGPPDVPKALTVKAGEPTSLTFTAPGDGKVGSAQAFDPAKCFVSRMWADDPASHVYMVFPKVPGEYRVVWWTAGETASVQTVITATGDAGPAPPPGPVDPPVTPPSGALYFMVIRPDGPASPEFTRVMQDPAWLELLAKGHTFKDKTVTEARPWFTPPPGTTLPVVLTLRTAGGKSVIARGPVALPTTADGIRGLPAGVP
jgi:hypothetical protein